MESREDSGFEACDVGARPSAAQKTVYLSQAWFTFQIDASVVSSVKC